MTHRQAVAAIKAVTKANKRAYSYHTIGRGKSSSFAEKHNVLLR